MRVYYNFPIIFFFINFFFQNHPTYENLLTYLGLSMDTGPQVNFSVPSYQQSKEVIISRQVSLTSAQLFNGCQLTTKTTSSSPAIRTALSTAHTDVRLKLWLN